MSCAVTKTEASEGIYKEFDMTLKGDVCCSISIFLLLGLVFNRMSVGNLASIGFGHVRLGIQCWLRQIYTIKVPTYFC